MADFHLKIMLLKSDWQLIADALKLIDRPAIGQQAAAAIVKEIKPFGATTSVVIERKTTSWIAVLNAHLDMMGRSKAYCKLSRINGDAFDRLWSAVSRTRNLMETPLGQH